MAIYVDVESTGLDPRVDDLRLVSIDGVVYDVWDDREREQAVYELTRRKQEEFVAHNAQFDLDFLAEHLCVHWEGPIFDTMVAFQVLENGRKHSASLGSVAKSLLQVELDKSLQNSGWGGFIFEDAREYASQDTKVLKQLHQRLSDGLRKAKLAKIFALEMQLLPVLVAARRRGIYFDVGAAQRLKKDLLEDAARKTHVLPHGINPRSPKQVAEWFKLPDSSEETLREAAGHGRPVLRKVMEIRKLLKKASTIEKQLIGHVRYDGRIHPSFTQCFTETGRLSSRDPNLQNQDRGADVRGLFLPMEGCRFVIADYSSLEVRIAALLAKEDKMLEVLREGRDLHSETCARIFGEETKQTRTLSKNILFGSLFGGGPGTVVRFAAKSDVVIDEAEARSFQKALFDAYPKLKRWHQRAGNLNKEYVYSVQGRRRYVEKGDGYNVRINHAVQSSAADGQKAAMVLLANQGLIPVGNIHDELLFEVQENQAEEALSTVTNTMTNAMYRALKLDPDNPVVPIKVEGGVGESWADKP